MTTKQTRLIKGVEMRKTTGTWTPSIGDGTTPFTPSGSNNGSYYLWGNTITYTFQCQWSSKAAAIAGNHITITGLPFTTAAVVAGGASFFYGSLFDNAWTTGAGHVGLFVENNVTVLKLQRNSAVATVNDAQASSTVRGLITMPYEA